MNPQDKWQVNMEKVAFAKQFPGLLRDWIDAKGKRIESVVQLDGRPGQVILFDDKTFLVTGPLDPEPADLLNGIMAAAKSLRAWYPEAFARLVELREKDDELTRLSRQEKILGAIRHNATSLPGLKEAITKLLKEL